MIKTMKSFIPLLFPFLLIFIGCENEIENNYHALKAEKKSRNISELVNKYNGSRLSEVTNEDQLFGLAGSVVVFDTITEGIVKIGEKQYLKSKLASTPDFMKDSEVYLLIACSDATRQKINSFDNSELQVAVELEKITNGIDRLATSLGSVVRYAGEIHYTLIEGETLDVLETESDYYFKHLHNQREYL